VFISLPPITSIATPQFWGSIMGQYSATYFKQFSYVLQNAKQRESYTDHGTHLKDVAFGLCALHMRLKHWLNITVLQPVIHADSQHLTTTVIRS
jgi:hypothetical protein